MPDITLRLDVRSLWIFSSIMLVADQFLELDSLAP